MGKEYVDELLVKLGLEADAKEFKQADELFANLRARALAFGAVVGAVAYGANKLVSDFAAANDPLGKFADLYGTTPQFVDALGFALAKSGGNAEEAYSSIKKIRDLMKDTRWGDIASDVFREAGAEFDPMLLAGVTDVAEAYERIATAAAQLNSNQRRDVLQALGFSDSEITLFAGGKDKMLAYFREAERLAPVTRDMTDNAARFNDASTSLSKAIEGVTDIFANRLTPALTETLDTLTGFLTKNKEGVSSTYEGLIHGTSMEIEGFAKWWDAMTSGNYAKASTMAVNGGLYVLGLDDADFVNRARSREASKHSISDQDWLDELTRPHDAAPLMLKGDSNVSYEINVDARGSTDPAGTAVAVESAVNRALSEAAKRARDDADEGLE